MKVFIGIDNGCSGSIGIIAEDNIRLFKTPVKSELSYTKVKQYITRIDFDKLNELFDEYKDDEVSILVERPLVNPTRFKATISGTRSLEATLIVIEQHKFRYKYIDSKEWQKELLPAGLKGIELKHASLDIGKRLFPNLDFKKLKDADGILIAEYLKRKEQ